MSALKCDICGGKLTMGEKGVAVCDSCGMEHTQQRMQEKIQEIKGTVRVDNSPLVQNYLKLANNALDVENNAEAELYANKIIEIHMDNYEAWMIKGKAIGWQSTLKVTRIAESSNAFNMAIQYAPEDKKQEVMEKAKQEIINLSESLIRARCDLYIEYPTVDEINGFHKDLDEIYSSLKRITKNVGNIIDVDSLMKPIGKKIDEAIVKAYTETIEPEYKGEDNKPDKHDLEKYLDRLDNNIYLQELVIDLYDDDEAEDIARLKRIIQYHEKCLSAVSYDWDYVGSTKVWHKDASLSAEGKKEHNDAIAKCRKKITELDEQRWKKTAEKINVEDKDKSIDEILDAAIKNLEEAKNFSALTRFRRFNEAHPYELVGRIGIMLSHNSFSTISLAEFMSHICYNTVEKKFTSEKEKLVSSEQYKEKLHKVINMESENATILMIAVANQNIASLEVVKFLIEHGSEINKRSKAYNVNALWFLGYAALKGSDEEKAECRKIAKYLIDLGSDVDVTNKGGVALYNKQTDSEIASYIKAKHSELKMGSQAKKKGCYVATCVYNSYDCPEVWRLRRFRDEYLDKSWLGRLFIKLYYTISPTLVKLFGKQKWFRNMFKSILGKFDNNLEKKGYEDTPYNDKY